MDPLQRAIPVSRFEVIMRRALRLGNVFYWQPVHRRKKSRHSGNEASAIRDTAVFRFPHPALPRRIKHQIRSRIRFFGSALSLTASQISSLRRCFDRRIAAWTSRQASDERANQPSHGCDRVWDVTLGPQRRRSSGSVMVGYGKFREQQLVPSTIFRIFDSA
jgi:hypothetical protein